MYKLSWSRSRPVRRKGLAALSVCIGVPLLAACATAEADATDLTPSGHAWRESVYENFAIDLSDREAECLALEVGDLSRMVGPLVGQRPDDTARSIWRAVDFCLASTTQGELARAIVYGGWSADEQTLAGVWDTADDSLAACISQAGGWRALGSYQALIATCSPATGAAGQS